MDVSWIKVIKKLPTKTTIMVVRGYRRFISPCMIDSCRFVPTCSDYAEQALERYGMCGGATRALWRILRCNPFSKGGYDPVEKRGFENGRGKT